MGRYTAEKAILRSLLIEALDLARKAYTAVTVGLNNLYTPTSANTALAAQTGSILTAPISFTPKISGKVKVSFNFSGRSDAADRLISLIPSVDGNGFGNVFTTSFAPGANATFDSNVSGTFVVTGLSVNAAHTFNFVWASSAGTWRATPSLGGVLIEELVG